MSDDSQYSAGSGTPQHVSDAVRRVRGRGYLLSLGDFAALAADGDFYDELRRGGGQLPIVRA